MFMLMSHACKGGYRAQGGARGTPVDTYVSHVWIPYSCIYCVLLRQNAYMAFKLHI